LSLSPKKERGAFFPIEWPRVPFMLQGTRA
jgi:hypothetical protein